MAWKIARTVARLVSSKGSRYSSRVWTRWALVEPREYMTSALAWAWLNPWFSVRKAICSGYLRSEIWSIWSNQ